MSRPASRSQKCPECSVTKHIKQFTRGGRSWKTCNHCSEVGIARRKRSKPEMKVCTDCKKSLPAENFRSGTRTFLTCPTCRRKLNESRWAAKLKAEAEAKKWFKPLYGGWGSLNFGYRVDPFSALVCPFGGEVAEEAA